MGKRIAAKITGVAGYVPPRVVTNFDLEKIVDTTDEWIRTRTGIRERHYADPGVGRFAPGNRSCKEVTGRKRRAGRRNRNDRRRHSDAGHAFPLHSLLDSGPSRRVERLGIRSFRRLLGLRLRADDGAQFVGAGTHKKVLVIGSDVMTSILDFKDRATCVLFGDGAGAVLVEPATSDSEGIIDFANDVDGSAAATSICRPEDLCIRRRTKRSTSACITFIRKANTFSNMRCAG